LTEDAWVADAMLDILGCALPPRSAVFLSTPITSGPRYVAWRQAQGDVVLAPDVVAANVEDGRQHAAQLRQRYAVVITPTELHVEHWTPAHYRAFWSEVMDRYVRLIVLGDGWSLSTGCVTEFIMARVADVPAVDYHEREIDDITATTVLREAVATLQAANLPTHVQIAALATLEEKPVIAG
jgi:hypothetical protein